MASEFRLSHRVQFVDTDLAGILHFSNFFRYMEMTEHAFYRSLNIRIHDYRSIDSKEIVGWPRVNAQCEYLKPVKFDDVVQIQLFVLKMTDKSIHYRFRFYTTYNDVNKLVAIGHIRMKKMGLAM